MRSTPVTVLRRTGGGKVYATKAAYASIEYTFEKLALSGLKVTLIEPMGSGIRPSEKITV